MVEIKLQDGYFIEIDPLNYTLRQRYSGKTKDGELKESVRTHGYYGSIRQAVDRYITLSQLDFMDGMSIDLKEYGRSHMARRAVQLLSGRGRA